MPKRISERRKTSERGFRSGYSTGVSAAIFAFQLQDLRASKVVTIEDVAIATELSVETITKLEQADMVTFLSMSIDSLFALAKYFDVAIEIKFTSHNTSSKMCQVKTFSEEVEELTKEQTDEC